MKRRAWFFWALLGVLGAGCSKGSAGASTSSNADEHGKQPTSAAEQHGDHKDEPEHEELPKRVHLKPDVIAASRIKTTPAAREVLETVLELPGEITGDPDKTARIAPPVVGRIERVLFTEGKLVKARELLAVVRVPDLADRQAALASATARAVAARANADRLAALAGKGLSAAQELADAKAQAAALEAEARAAAERLRALDLGATGKPGSLLEVRSPIDGTVVARDAVMGQAVGPEQPIATIADLGEVWFLGRVFESDLARVQVGAAAEVQLNAYPKERFEGRITLIGRQIDPVARTVVARIPLANRQELLRLGLFGTARISAGDAQKREPSLVVLRTAVTEINGKPFVFVRHPDDDFELHPIVVGRAALGKVEVLSGLREGEQVVSDGVFTLKSLVLKSTIAEDE
ncbi:Cobalt/zinc/cadmium efflux RND transporter [Minicystis rosea]|nr:Cobalt/zinc/cadmium efflux RND transporter [Minicystis rosea]